MVELSIEHHVFTQDGRHFIYFPTKDVLVEIDEHLGKVLGDEGNGSVDLKEALVDSFSCLNAADDIAARIKPKPALTEFRPTDLTVLLNNFCNLSCSYCYATSAAKGREVSESDLKSAMSFAVGNAAEVGRKSCTLCLHGFGEPTLSWTLIETSVRYFNELCSRHSLKPIITIGSNGVMDESKREFIVNNFVTAFISVDGVGKLHDCQRPMRNGRGSFEKVEETLRYFHKNNFAFTVRATVTTANVFGLPDLAKYIGENCSGTCKELAIDPINLAGKAENAAHHLPDWGEFVRIYIATKEEAKKYGLRINFLGTHDRRIYFCNVPDNFVLGFNGLVSSCFECSEEDQASAEYFLYGKYDSGRLAKVDLAKINRIRSMSVDSLEVCKSCFARYRCGGDCLSRRLAATGDMTKPFEWRCNVIREVTQLELVDRIDGCLSGPG